MPLAPNQILRQRYQIQAELGRGGFGIVYRAFDLHLNRLCAVKENLDASPAAQAQFQYEAHLLAQLHNDHLPQVVDHFIEPNGLQYLVMEFIPDEDLQARVARLGPLSEAKAQHLVFQVLDTLEYLHKRQPPVIHRDIKPANIRVTPDDRAILVDLGIAKAAVTGVPTAAAARGITPGYSPFEQYGQGTTDARSDIYALGATLYFLLTGNVPPDAPTRASGGVPLKPPHGVNSAISRAVSDAVMQAMGVYPQNRFQSVSEMRDALRGRTVTAPPIDQSGPYIQISRGLTTPRPALWIAATAFGVLAFVLGVGLAVSVLTPKTNGVSTETFVGQTAVSATPTWTPSATRTNPTPSPTLSPVMTNTPTSVPTATNTPAPILPLQPTTIFQDDFDESSLNRWDIEADDGILGVHQGILQMSSAGTNFPYLTTRANPFPANGDYRMTARFRYAAVKVCGVGIMLTNFTVPPRWSEERTNSYTMAQEAHGISVGVWQDDKDGLYLKFRSGGENQNRISVLGTDTNWHELVITYQGARYQLALDDNIVFVSSPTAYRANAIWLGNPVELGQGFACPWDTLQIDSIQVEQLP
ncbi:MAG: hypothetical protein BroJett039_07070 [Chloroflexota bacterium]|nr:MAG: hypothetical protein BroJett039_07070 [Chloroflexota bacterium]